MSNQSQRSLLDVSPRMIRTMLEHKANWDRRSSSRIRRRRRRCRNSCGTVDAATRFNGRAALSPMGLAIWIAVAHRVRLLLLITPITTLLSKL
jgi:hypothetical protein